MCDVVFLKGNAAVWIIKGLYEAVLVVKTIFLFLVVVVRLLIKNYFQQVFLEKSHIMRVSLLPRH